MTSQMAPEKIDKPQVLLLLMFLASTAAELSCSEQAALEIEKLKSAHRAELSTLRAQIEQLRSENGRPWQSAESLGIDIGAKEAADEGAKYGGAQIANESKKTRKTRKEFWRFLLSRKLFKSGLGVTWNSRSFGKTCAGRCLKNCWIPNMVLDAKCHLANSSRVRWIKSQVKFVGTKAHPRWDLYAGSTVAAQVSCPCVGSNGHTLTEAQATDSIVGQVAAVGIPAGYAAMALGVYGDGRRRSIVEWNARLVLSTLKMVKCWRAACFGGSHEAQLEQAGDVQATGDGFGEGLDALLDASDGVKQAAGWDCG